MQSQAIDNERKAYEMAILKEQQDRIKRVEEEQRQKDYEENAGVRFNQALRRLEN